MKKLIVLGVMLLLVSCLQKNNITQNSLEIPPFLQQNEN